MNKMLPVLLISSLLAGCGSESESQTDLVEESESSQAVSVENQGPTDPLEMARSNPDSLREAMNDPAQREALIQSMRERRERMGEDGRVAGRDELRERMRERRAELGAEQDPERRRAGLRERQLAGAAAWWEDPAMSEQLGLSEAQREQIESANSEREAGIESARTAMTDAQRQLMQAARSGERSQIESLLFDRHEAMNALNEAELSWQRQLLATLSDEQLRDLASQNPQVLIGRQRPN